MPTFLCAEDVVLTAALAVDVQPMTRMQDPDTAADPANNAPENLQLFPSGDSFWISVRL